MMDIKIYQDVADIVPPADRDVIVVMTEEFVPELPAIRQALAGRRYHGAVVPNLIRDRQLIERGIAVMTLPPGHLAVACDMNIDADELAPLLARRHQCSSLLLFVDGLSPAMDRFTSTLDGCIGSLPVLGTGVGYKDFQQRPVIFDEHGLAADRALIIGTDVRLQVGARHGWESLHGPLVVTRAEDNILFELNSQPAFDVYARAIAAIDGVEITRENFLVQAHRYPLGIATFQGGEVIVRDPIAANPDGSMTIVSSVKAMDTLYIMKGDPAALIAASSTLARESFAHTTSSQAFLFDCISRVIFLKHDYGLEIAGMLEQSRVPGLEIHGITSIGEITNVGYDSIKVLNKTTLLGVLEHA